MTAIEQIERCATCKFSLELGLNVEFVLCRRRPPMGASSVRPLTNGGTLTTDFPTVHPQNWCGEYQPKPERDADG